MQVTKIVKRDPAGYHEAGPPYQESWRSEAYRGVFREWGPAEGVFFTSFQNGWGVLRKEEDPFFFLNTLQ